MALLTSTFVSCGRRGAWRHRPSFCKAAVALAHINLRFFVPGMTLVDIDLRFAWQAWRLLTSTFVLRGRRGTWRHRPWFYVEGVALDKRFAWQVWRLATALVTLVLRGRRSSWRHRPWFCVAGVALAALGWVSLVARGAAALCVAGAALTNINFRFAWQAWRLATSTLVLRGRRGAQ